MVSVSPDVDREGMLRAKRAHVGLGDRHGADLSGPVVDVAEDATVKGLEVR